MTSYEKKLKTKLYKILEEMEKSPEKFVKNPGKDFTRKSKLSFSKTIDIIIKMEGKSLNKEILDYFSYNKDELVTSSAFVQQRQKISLSAFIYLFYELNKIIKIPKKYKDYRLVAVDGSHLIYNSNKKEKENYVQTNKKGKSFNSLHLNTMYDILNNVYVDLLIQPNKGQDEHKAFLVMLKNYSYSGKTIFIADKGYESYNGIATLHTSGYNYIIKVKSPDKHSILSNFDLPDEEEFDVIRRKIYTRNASKIKGNPQLYKVIHKQTKFDYLNDNDEMDITFRIVKMFIGYNKNGMPIYQWLITNLPCDMFSFDDLKNLYHKRWGIETSYRQLKHTVGMLYFNSKKAESVSQEIYASIIMFNFSSSIANNTEIIKKMTQYIYKPNFVTALAICKKFLKQKRGETPLDVEGLIKMFIVPIKPNRKFPRNTRYKQPKPFNYRIS